jgi:AcrR family transcriptional regulator
MATQADRSASTRGAIVNSARQLFTEHGYVATSITDILEATGLSRGALYHHFASKEDIFAVVFLETSSDAIRLAGKRAKPTETPLAALIAGCLAWIDIATEPAVARVLFEDGPLALGWERCRTLEEATSLRSMRRSIQAAIDSGEVEVQSADVVARLINGLLSEAVLDLIRSGGRTRKREVSIVITTMINGLKAS